MEPFSIVRAVGSILGIIDVATRCIGSLQALQQRWTNADLTVSLLIGQMSTFKAALDQIQEWIVNISRAMSQHHQLVMDLDASLNSCQVLISSINNHVVSLGRNNLDQLTFESKAKAMWQDPNIQIWLNHLHHQTAALNLLLTALNCRSLSDQRDLLSMTASRTIIDQVKDDSSSLICLRDSASVMSTWTSSTNHSSLFSRTFGFDDELLISKVYKGQIKSLMRRASRKGRIPDRPSSLSATQDASREGKEEMKKSKAIEQQLKRDRKSQRDVVKLLLVGPEGSGQSTILDTIHLSQIRLYGLELRESYRPTVLFSCLPEILNQILLELKRIDPARATYSPRDNEYLPEDTKENTILHYVVTAIVSLWQDQAFKSCYETCKTRIGRRAPAYFLDSILRIGDPVYVPNDRDILFAKEERRLAESSFEIGELTYTLIKPQPDMMNPLEKKLALFDNVEAVIFETDLSVYDQFVTNIQEDIERRSTSPLGVAIRNFQHLCASAAMGQKPAILVLNRVDVFREKIQSQPLQRLFADYKGGSDTSEATDYVLNQFISMNESDQRKIYTHFAAGDEDPNIFPFFMAAVDDIIIQECLHPAKI